MRYKMISVKQKLIWHISKFIGLLLLSLSFASAASAVLTKLDNVTGTPSGNTVTLTWTSKDFLSGSTGCGYKIVISTEITGPWDYLAPGDFKVVATATNSGIQMTHTIYSLIPNTYYFKVWAKNEFGEWSPESDVPTTVVVGGSGGGGGTSYVAQPITSLDTSPAPSYYFGAGTVKLSWAAPNDFPSGSSFKAVVSTSINGPWGLNAINNSYYSMSTYQYTSTGTQMYMDVYNLQYNNLYYFRVFSKVGTAGWSGGSNIKGAAVKLVAGDPAYVRFENAGFTVAKDAASQTPVKFTLVDNNWMPTAATSTVVISLSSKVQVWNPDYYYYSYSDDTSGLFSLTNDFSNPITEITLNEGGTGGEFYYKTSAEPQAVIRASYCFSWPSYQDLSVNVVNGGINNARVHKGDYTSNTSVALGTNELAYIDFDLNMDASNVSWQALISTSSDHTNNIWEYSGYGMPYPGRISWDGYMSYYDATRGYYRRERAPNGTYYIRIQLGNGGIINDTLSATIQSLEIKGRIIDSNGGGVSNAQISAYGPSYAYTSTDPDGYYTLSGLAEGKYNINVDKYGFATLSYSNISTGDTLNITMQQPSTLLITATRGMSASVADPEVWGGIRLYTSDYSSNFWGTLHFNVDVSTSDNGMWAYSEASKYEVDNSSGGMYSAGKYTIMSVVPGTYILRADIDGYDYIEQSVTIAANATQTVTLDFPLKKVVSGTVYLSDSSTDLWGTWVSVEAVKSGDTFGTSWSNVSIPYERSSGTYVLSGLNEGSYSIRASAPGYHRSSAAITINHGEESVAVPDITLGTGGGLAGTVTIEGDTTDTSLGFSDPFYVYLNAWSPDSYSYGWTQVAMTKSASGSSSSFIIKGLDDGTYWINSWINGFELAGTVGGNGVKAVVSGGAGSIDLKFKRYSGKIKCTFVVPDNDYGNLQVSINGPNVWLNNISYSSFANNGITFDNATGVLTSPSLGSGFYQISGIYNTTGMQKSKGLMVVNGQEKTTSIDLTAQTYSVSGTVSISQSNPPSGYTDISVLAATAPINNVVESIGAFGNPVSTTSFRVIAIDYLKKDKMDMGGYIMGAVRSKTGIINADGSYEIKGLIPGIYLLRINPLELDGDTVNGKETATVEKRVVVVGSNLTGKDIEVSKGYTVSGTVKLPQGETASRDFTVTIFKANDFSMDNFGSGGNWANYVGSVRAALVGSNSDTYEIKGLASGDYAIAVQDWGYQDQENNRWIPRQYANKSINVKVESSDIEGQDIQLSRGGKIKFKLRDADSGTVITPENMDKVLPKTYDMTAMANPWVEGGWGHVERQVIGGANLGAAVGANNWNATNDTKNFVLTYLPEATYDVLLGQSAYGFMAMDNNGISTGNQANYAFKTLSGVKVVDGQTTDIGVVDIKQGLSVTGTVKDKNGSAISNIPVIAVPSLSDEWSSELRGITDTSGVYNITGLDPSNEYYDIIACPRINADYFGGYFFFGDGGITYGEKNRAMVKIKTASNIDFVLEEALGSVVGKITTEDGGSLQYPMDTNLPKAAVYMQLENTFPRTNPIGDIQAATELDGTFSIQTLSPGTYKLVVLSGGYASYSKTVVVGKTEVDAGTMQLKVGAMISGSITKSDNTNPSTSEINSIIAANDDLSELIVGTLVNSGEKAVSGYELNGFQAGITYNIMFIDSENELLPAKTDYRVQYSSFVKTDEDLKYTVSKPAVFSRIKRSANKYTINFQLTGAMRNTMPADSDLSSIITVVSGSGQLGDLYMAPGRKILSCTYTAPSGENRFTLKLAGYSHAIDPSTGKEFQIDESFEYFTGIGARNKIKITNLRGGKITLDDDASTMQFSPGTFNVNYSTASLLVEFSKADSLDELITSAPGKRGLKLTIPRPSAAYPNDLYSAMKFAQDAGITPYSSFYDILLPAGVSRTLKKSATLTLQYSGVTDPSQLNIYYYDATNNVYLLENTNRTIDTENSTISVGVSHTSVFTVIASNSQVIAGTSYSGNLFVYNYPNPANLSAKTVTLQNTLTQETRNITGTLIHYGLPQDMSGEIEIKIYNVAGELIRTINDGQKTGGSHYYTEWDGTNDAGKKAASGVYLGRFTIDNKNEKFFKMAIVK